MALYANLTPLPQTPRPFVGLHAWRGATHVCVLGFAHYARKPVLGGRVVPGGVGVVGVSTITERFGFVLV